MLGLGSNLDELKSRIQKAQEQIAQLGSPEPLLPEMITATNALRINEYLTKSDEHKTRLISAYDEYTRKLEEIIASLLDIQSDLKDIVKTETSIIAESSKIPKRHKKTKGKIKK